MHSGCFGEQLNSKVAARSAIAHERSTAEDVLKKCDMHLGNTFKVCSVHDHRRKMLFGSVRRDSPPWKMHCWLDKQHVIPIDSRGSTHGEYTMGNTQWQFEGGAIAHTGLKL